MKISKKRALSRAQELLTCDEFLKEKNLSQMFVFEDGKCYFVLFRVQTKKVAVRNDYAFVKSDESYSRLRSIANLVGIYRLFLNPTKTEISSVKKITVSSFSGTKKTIPAFVLEKAEEEEKLDKLRLNQLKSQPQNPKHN